MQASPGSLPAWCTARRHLPAVFHRSARRPASPHARPPLPTLLRQVLYCGLLTTDLTLLMEVFALQDVSSVDAAIIYTLEPVLGAGFAWVSLGEWAGLGAGPGAVLGRLGLGAAALGVALRALRGRGAAAARAQQPASAAGLCSLGMHVDAGCPRLTPAADAAGRAAGAQGLCGGGHHPRLLAGQPGDGRHAPG